MGKGYADVLNICVNFLRRHPSETILMSVDDEDRFDSTLGRSAPSQLFGKLFTEEASLAENTRSFEDTFKARTWECGEDSPLFYNFAAAPPGSNSDDKIDFVVAHVEEAIRGDPKDL